MCDYSLKNVRSRPAKVADKLTTRDFGTGTRGFAAAEDASKVAYFLSAVARCKGETVTPIAGALVRFLDKMGEYFVRTRVCTLVRSP